MNGYQNALERRALIDCFGIAVVFMFRADPALAGSYLQTLVDLGFLNTEDGLQMMDELRALPAEPTQGDT